MKTAFTTLNVQEYLKTKREATERKELLTGLHFTNQRQQLIQTFVDRINEERKGSKYPPVTWSQINGQLRHLKDCSDLQLFYRQCSDGRCFTALFWWKLKQAKKSTATV